MPSKTPKQPPLLPPATPPWARFKARFLGYAIGLLPILGMILLLRHLVPQWVGLALTTGGLYFSVLRQQAAQKRFPYDFQNREEWLALGIYAAIVVALVLSIPLWH